MKEVRRLFLLRWILYICNEANLVEENGYDTERVYAYRIDQETGEISVIQHIAVEGTHPRIFALILILNKSVSSLVEDKFRQKRPTTQMG